MPRQELDDAITAVSEEVALLSADEPAAFNRLHAQIASLKDILSRDNADQGVIIAGGVNGVHSSQNFDWPINFLPNGFSCSGLQADIVVPAGFTFISMAAGPAATAAQKQIQNAVIGGNIRLILFGLNATVIGKGLLLTVTFKVDATVPARMYPLCINGPVASDPVGNSLLISATSGTAIVTG